MIERILKAIDVVCQDRDEVALLRAENDRLRDERDYAVKQKEDLFEFVQRMERQRDDWRARFMEQWRQHQNAQSMLEDHIYAVGTTLVKALAIVNGEREAQGKPPIDMPGLRRIGTQGEKLLRTAAEYGDAMRSLEATRPKRDGSGTIVGWTKDPAEPDLHAEPTT